MELAYLVDRPVGVYEPNDIEYVRRMLDRDDDAGNDSNRLRMYRLTLCTPLAWGAVAEVIRETDDWSFCRILEGGPPGPFYVLPDHLATVPEFVKSLKARDRDHLYHGKLPHERIPSRPRVEPPEYEIDHMGTLQPRSRRKVEQAPLLSLDDDVPEWAA